jgi:hypothetical protein
MSSHYLGEVAEFPTNSERLGFATTLLVLFTAVARARFIAPYLELTANHGRARVVMMMFVISATTTGPVNVLFFFRFLAFGFLFSLAHKPTIRQNESALPQPDCPWH